MVEQKPKSSPGYEQSDATLRPLLLFFGGLAVLCALVFVGMVAMFNVFQRSFAEAERAQAPAPPPLATARQVPPEPRLQYAEPADLAKFRSEQANRFDSYGWVDRNKGVVHIPVSRALSIIGQRGLAVRAPPALVKDGKGP
jgi:hypothetical protein